MGHHAVTERRKTRSASGLVEVESHDFNCGSVSIASSAQMSVPSVSRATNIVISPLYLLFLLILRYALCLRQKTRYFPFTTPSDT